MPPVKLQQIADAAGVHRSTASRALNIKYRAQLSPELVHKVEVAARALGYRPNVFAASLRTRQSNLVGIVVPDIANPIFGLILSGITAEFAKVGKTALLAVGDEERQREEAVRHLLSLQVDGIVMATARIHDEQVSRLMESGVPLVLVHRREDRLRASTVISDNDEGVRQVVEHLTALGHRHVGLTVGPQQHSLGRQRVLAFEREAEKRAIRFSVVTGDDYSAAAGRKAADDLLADGSVTAVFAGNDMMACGIYEALAARGLRCPRDVSVIGYNDMPFASILQPPLTTVHVDHAELGRRVALQLLEHMRAPVSPPRLVVMPVRLEVRASTGPACASRRRGHA